MFGTVEEINARLSVINTDIQTRGAEISEDELSQYETEIGELTEQRAQMVARAERRQRILGGIASGTSGTSAPTMNSFNEQRSADEDDKFSTPEYRRAFMNHVLCNAPIPAEYRADSFATTAEASVGAVIPSTVLNQIIEKLQTAGKILAKVTRTSYKGGVSIPTSSVKPVATWVSERGGSDTQEKTVPKSGVISFGYHKLRCAVAVSLEVETMALPIFESRLMENVVEAMTRALDEAIIKGNGIGKPKGITVETPVTGQSISVATLSYSDLINAEAALPEEYENGAEWCMSKKTFMQYYGLLDSDGQPIGRVNFGITREPERYLLGRPVTTTEWVTTYTSTLAANSVFAFLFNFKDYAMNTNYQMGIKKYEDNDTDDHVTKAIMLADGKVVDNRSYVALVKADAPATDTETESGAT